MSPSTESKMLVALDGSKEAMRAIPIARTLAAQLHARVVAVHVAEAAPADARASLHLDAPEFDDVSLELRTGRPAEAILSEMQQPQVELLVMTTLASGDPDRPLGSVADEVAACCDRPIVTLRPEIGGEPERTAPAFTRLLVPIDGTRETAWALQPVTSLARRLGASVDVLYVVTPQAHEVTKGAMHAPRYVDQPHHEWRDWEHEVKERLMVECAGFPPSAAVDVHVREGEPGPQIVQFAREGNYDAIVLVRRSRLEPDRARTLRHVIRESPCPLLIVGGEHEG